MRRSYMDAARTGKFIAERRNALGMTQKQLADQLGVQQGQISLYETDKDEPPVVVKERIAELLDVSLDFLNGRTPDESGHLSDLDTSLTMMLVS